MALQLVGLYVLVGSMFSITHVTDRWDRPINVRMALAIALLWLPILVLPTAWIRAFNRIVADLVDRLAP